MYEYTSKVKASILELNRKIEILKKRNKRYKEESNRNFRTVIN